MSLRDMFLNSKKKRPRITIDDLGESNRSFVSNFKSRMSGLVPARISQWFSSSRIKSTGNGSTAIASFTDSSDDEPEILPPKRKRYNTHDAQYNEPVPAEPITPFHAENPDVPNNQNILYTSIQSAPGPSNVTQEANYAATQYISNNEDQSSEVGSVHSTDRDTTLTSSHTPSLSSQSVASRRKSIFEKAAKVKVDDKTTDSWANTSLNPDMKQRFKSSLYGSPFYPGPINYGGASASTYINHSIHEQKAVRVRESQNTTSSDLSSATRRILDLLENCSSPLTEAKRIPVNQNHLSKQFNSTPSTSKSNAYKTQELNMPSVASILRLKQRSRLMDTTKAARQIIASHSSTLTGFHPYTEEDIKKVSDRSIEKERTPKLKMHLTRVNRGGDLYDMPEPVQLPTAILHIDKDNLPKFSITSPTGITTMFSTAPSPTVITSTYEAQGMSRSDTMSSLFTNTGGSKTPPRALSDAPMFKFASPAASPVAMLQDSQNISIISRSDNCDVNEPKAKTSQPNTDFTKKVESSVITSTFGSSTDWKCSDCWVNNKAAVEKCVACGGKRPSVEDKCTQRQLVAVPASTPALHVKNPEDDWKCENCWIKNKISVNKCAACGGSKPDEKESTAPAPHATQSEKDWKCENCWIHNKSSVKKCAACGGSKSGGKEVAEPAPQPVSHSPLYKPPNGNFQDIMRAQKGKWECSSCLIRNEPDKTKCQCCDMEREGPSKEITVKPFNFPKESNIHFKFGIDPKEQEKIIAMKAEQAAKPGLTMLEQTETNNNTYVVIAKSDEQKPDDKKNDDRNSNMDSVVPEGPKTFTFGIPKTDVLKNQSPPVVMHSVEKSKEKLAQETSLTLSPELVMPPRSETAESFSSVVSTSTPMVSTEPQQHTATVSAASLANKNIPNEIQNASTAFHFADGGADKPKSFSFGSEPHAVTGLFGASSTPTTTVFSFGAPMQSAPVAITAAPSVPMFSSPQPTSTMGAPSALLFTSPHTTTGAALQLPSANIFGAIQPATATCPTTTAAAPLFNLRSDGPNVKSTPSFSFGSAKENDNKASHFGAVYKTGVTSSAFSMGTAAPLSGSGAGGMATSMSGVNQSGAGASTSGLKASAQETAWGGKGDASFVAGGGGAARDPAPFAFNAIGNQFSGSGAGAGAPAPTLFGVQSSTGGQNVFGMSSVGAGASGGIFGNASQPTQPPSIFGAQPAPIVFGAHTQPSAFGAPLPSQASTFGAASSTQPPAFGTPIHSQPSAFGAPSPSQPPFGAPVQSQPLAFGAVSQSQPSTFGPPPQSLSSTFGPPPQSLPSTFGPPPQSQPPTFGPPPQSQPPTFGASAQSQPTVFGAPAPPSGAQAPAFNFSSGVFNFGQQAQQPQSQPSSMYNFGSGNPGGMSAGMGGGMMAQPMDGGMGGGSVQFNIGSGAGRRVRKAVRRNPPR